MSGRVLALDVGGKRIGVAMSDPDRIIASGLPTIDAQPPKQAFQRISQLIAEHGVTQVVIGLPLTMRGEVGPQAEVIHTFAAELGKRVTVPIALYDERLSSVAADRSLQELGVKRQKRRDHVDQMAATLILQGYLDTLRNPPLPWPKEDDDDWDDE